MSSGSVKNVRLVARLDHRAAANACLLTRFFELLCSQHQERESCFDVIDRCVQQQQRKPILLDRQGMPMGQDRAPQQQFQAAALSLEIFIGSPS
jgi:hypothetical protein